MGCFVWLLVLIGGILLVLSLIRWFEQVTEAVQHRWWNKIILLVVFPPSVWFFLGRIAAGRPVPVPLHEPVRGFGSLPKEKPAEAPKPVKPATQGVDAEKLAKLQRKMREQGMMDSED